MVPVGLSPGLIASIGTYKPIARRSSEYPCHSRLEEDRYRIEFPTNVTVGDLPRGVTYSDGAIHYQSTYEKRGHAVEVHRVLEVQRSSDLCTPQDNEAWKAFHSVLQRDLRAQVFYR
jgi:hypothetical protein